MRSVLLGLVCTCASLLTSLVMLAPVANPQRALGVNELMFVSPWFMRLFTGFEPWSAALSMFDHCVVHGQGRRPRPSHGARCCRRCVLVLTSKEGAAGRLSRRPAAGSGAHGLCTRCVAA
jgi:hypothetical protein